MKQTITILLLITIIYSCKKKDDTPSSPSPQTPSSTWTFSAVVNGSALTADSIDGGMYIDTSLGFAQRTFLVGGYFGSKFVLAGFVDSINSTLLSTLSYDDLLFAGASMDFMDTNDTVNEFYFEPTLTHFSITSVDNANKKASGTFYGVLVADVSGDTVVITNGIFKDIPYQI